MNLEAFESVHFFVFLKIKIAFSHVLVKNDGCLFWDKWNNIVDINFNLQLHKIEIMTMKSYSWDVIHLDPTLRSKGNHMPFLCHDKGN